MTLIKIKTIDSVYKHKGTIENPDGHAHVKGICGDEMDFYLSVSDNIITEVKYTTTGCEHSHQCAETAAKIVSGKPIDEVLSLSPHQIRSLIPNLPPEHTHCAILATITLFKAIAHYMLKKGC